MLDWAEDDSRRVALADDSVIPVLLLELGIPGNIQRWTDSPVDVTAGGQTYTANSPIEAISLPELAGESARQLLALRLADPAASWRNTLRHGYSGIPMTAAVVLVTGTGPLVYSDVIEVNEGRSVAMSTVEGTSLELVFAGPLAKLDNEHARVTTQHSQQQVDATDTSHDYAHAARSLKWGKE